MANASSPTSPTSPVLRMKFSLSWLAPRVSSANSRAIGAGLLAVSVAGRLVEGDDASLVLGLDLGSEAVLMVAVIALGDTVRNRRSLRAQMERQAAAAGEQRRREAARQIFERFPDLTARLLLRQLVHREAHPQERPLSAFEKSCLHS